MNNVKKYNNKDVYLTLDDTKSDDVILKHNLAVLVSDKNATIQNTAKALVSIPAALVKMKWQNRREIYAWQVKEEIYGAVINEIIARRPDLKEKILDNIEASYQNLRERETATLTLTRKLADGNYRSSNVRIVPLATAEAAVPPSVPTSSDDD
ncbi:cytoplasmic protein [Klebsiella sp. RIT-PI-d]|nr:cytoplasmic protein [Klebsiella sp. RIT-PI-d]